MAKDAKLKMGLPTGGSVILSYEIRVGAITGLYHVTAKLEEGRDASIEEQTVVDPADLIG